MFIRSSVLRSSRGILCRIAVGFSLWIALVVQAVAQSKPNSSSELLLKNEHGPWLVMAMSFEGEGAKKKAVQLAAELRRDFGLQAYCMPKSFDYTETVIGAGFSPTGGEKRMKYRDHRVVEACAVLVGDFDSMDGVAIDDTLEKIKQISPKFFGTKDAQTSDEQKISSYDYRNYLKKWVDKKEKKDLKPGPMFYAFKTRNPLLPADYYKAPEVDKFVKKLNQEKPFAQHNLMECEGKFTVRVLTLRGLDSYISWGKSSDNNSEQAKSQLEIAAEQAYRATMALRMAGYEAYQFHDRQQSIVTVGSFTQLGTADSTNKFIYDEAIRRVVSDFGGKASTTVSQFGVSQTPKTLLDKLDQRLIAQFLERHKDAVFTDLAIPFDLIPTPMMVPKLESSSIYSSYTLGK